ncbi:MAG: cobalt ECF transporter T component CbiQ [Bacillota bacterium]|nr:cobalt ECF transporter T component CbiQ [Bacillota bacterium]
MSDIIKSLKNLKELDGLAREDSAIHRISPVAKLAVTLAYIVILTSFGRYETTSLLPYVLYPVIVFAACNIKAGPILIRTLYVLPLVAFIGVFNLLFEKGTFILGETAVSAGWFTLMSLLLKCCLSVAAALLLMATTGMDKIAHALRKLKVPKLFVLQLVLTYRYISVLIEEAGCISRAYALRSPKHKAIRPRAWGPLIGLMLLRTYGRAQRVYDAMCIRGFDGDYLTCGSPKMRAGDWAFMLGWTAGFILARIVDIPAFIGKLITGVM